jgi:all-trans-8'-apo-beta-carotenal 15,15'-oxygenase
LGTEVAPPQGIAKFDLEQKETQVWMPKEYEFCGEPMFAARKNASPEEDDGYILSVLYNGKSEESEMVILCANAIADGPIARLPLGMRVPHGLYGCFTNAEEAKWSTEEIERRAKLADKMESRGNNWNEVKSDFSGLGLRLDDFEEYFGDIL